MTEFFRLPVARAVNKVLKSRGCAFVFVLRKLSVLLKPYYIGTVLQNFSESFSDKNRQLKEGQKQKIFVRLLLQYRANGCAVCLPCSINCTTVLLERYGRSTFRRLL